MHISRRATIAGAWLAVLAWSLWIVGCHLRTDKETPARTSDAAGGEGIRLVHHIDWYEKSFDAAIHAYNAKHPRFPVRQQILPTNGLEMFFRTQLIAKQAPELMGNQEYKRFGRMGLLLNLQPILDKSNPYLAPVKPWRAFFPDAALQNVTSPDGAIYGLPYERTDIGFIYNKQIFARLGITSPHTWDEWMEDCRKIKAAGYVPIAWDGQYGMGALWFIRSLLDATYRELEPEINVRVTDPHLWYDLRRQFADAKETIDLEELYRAFHIGLIDVSSPRMKFAYDRLKELVQFFQPDFAVAPQSEMMQLFLDRRAACVVQGTFLLDIVRDKIKSELEPKDRFEVSIFPMPQFPEAQVGFKMGVVRSTGGFGAGLVFTLPAYLQGGKRDAAIDFMHYMYSRPVYRKVYTQSPKLGAPLYPDIPTDPGMQQFQSRGVTKIDLIPSDPQMSAEWYIHLQAYLFGRIDWPEFVRRLDRLYRVSLEREVKRGVLDPKKALAMRMGA